MTDTCSPDQIQSLTEIQQWLRSYVGRLLSIEPSEVDLTQPLEALALDSLNIVRMAGDLEDYLQIEVESSLIYEYESLNAFCHQLEQMHAGSHERKKESGQPIHVSIAASFTSEPVEESYVHWLKSLGYNPTVEFAGYNQLFQELLNPQSTLANQKGKLKIVLFRVEDWFRFESGPVVREKANKTKQEFIEALQQFTKTHNSELILGLCPHSSAQVRQLGLSAILDDLDDEILVAAEEISNVIALDLRSLPETYQVQRVLDEARDKLGHIPFTPAFFSALGTELARWSFNLLATPRKVIVLDCDNTLWQGVVGEDGPLGINLSSPFLQLQSFMRDQREHGKLLCLSSKNNESDVLEVFDLRPDMHLRKDEIIAHRINWNRKSQSLSELADELNLGLDSFIFVDDNPAECQEVATVHPEVLVVQIPNDTKQIPDFLSHHWAFDAINITEEDRKRTELYRNNQQREALRAESHSFQEFIKSLEVKTMIRELKEDDVVRAAQLTHRTNQFNATTIRRNENEIRTLLHSRDYQVESVHVSDRFGDYGTVGLLVSKREPNALVAETFLMSCRVLGKQVEQTMVAHLVKQAESLRLGTIALHYQPSEKNQPLHRFYHSLGLQFESVDGDLQQVRLKTNQAASRLEASVTESKEQTRSAKKEPSVTSLAMTFPHSPALQAIANARGETQIIQDTIRGNATMRRGELKTAFIAPRTAWQKKISAIWCDVLQIDRVGIYDSFFELGGDSLKAAEVFARMWEIGAPQSISLVNIPEPTIAVLCQAIEDVKAGRTPSLVTHLVSLEQEGQVPDDIANEGYDPCTYDTPMKHVFMTGTTGYLGAFLLSELMLQTDVNVNCLVRASTPSEGRRRIEKNLSRYGIWNDAYHDRISITLGELTEPRFGLTCEEFNLIASGIDTIFHSGAWVNFVFPYERLKPAHVDAFETVMRLAVAAKPKPIALHFISTLGVIMSTGYGESDVVTEDEPLRHVEGLLNGYEQAKHVADKMAWTGMKERGIPTAIYRPGMVGGDSQSGEYHKVDEFLSSFYKGCIQLGSWPLLNTTWEVVPVDYLCKAIVHGAKNPANLNQAYFTLHPEPTMVSEYIEWFQQYGYPIRALPWDVWKKELLSQGTEKLRQNALFPFVDFIRALYEEQVRFPTTDRSNFKRLTDAAGLDCPSQLEVLEGYVNHFIRTHYLDAPTMRQAPANPTPDARELVHF